MEGQNPQTVEVTTPEGLSVVRGASNSRPLTYQKGTVSAVSMLRRAGSRGAAGMAAGGLAIGSAEARRLATPVSGLRCSLTLIVHIHGPLHILSIFWPSCFSTVDRFVRALFPIGKLICARPLVDLVPQQLHAVAELTPDLLVRMNELPHSRHPSTLPWPIYGWLPSPV